MKRFIDLGSSMAAAFGTVCLALGLLVSSNVALADPDVQNSCRLETGNCGSQTLCTSKSCDYSSAQCPCNAAP